MATARAIISSQQDGTRWSMDYQRCRCLTHSRLQKVLTKRCAARCIPHYATQRLSRVISSPICELPPHSASHSGMGNTACGHAQHASCLTAHTQSVNVTIK
jgi:hypothetical protein